MTSTKGRVLEKTREVLGLLTHHPLETKTAKELFQSMAVSVFRFSAAHVRWSQAELDQLESLWTRTYKRAEYLPNGTASDIFFFPKKWGVIRLMNYTTRWSYGSGMKYNIIVGQEL